MIDRITQSFMKAMRAYLAGKGCGHLIQVKYVNEEDVEDASASMQLGSYFEYISFGSLPKSGIVPLPEYMATPLKDVEKGKRSRESLTVEDMYVEYRRAHANSKRVIDYLNIMGLKIISAGKKITKGRFEGTVDLIVEATRKIKFQSGHTVFPGKRFVIDFKYSGLIEDFRTEHGWRWTDEQRRYHGTQAKQYTFLTGMDFYFMVVSSKNETDIEFFRVIVGKDAIDKHVIEGNALMESLKVHADIGFEPRPELSQCLECVLASRCPHKLLFPHAVDVEL